ncbi:MAG: hypothetical protein HC904_14880 [Blastochloris sp.]|nr:hypothetical protein [Blastochloris sp.]
MACAQESLKATRAMDEELKMAVSVAGGESLMLSVAALHLGRVEGRAAGSPGAEFYVMAGPEVEVCADLSAKAEACFESLVCVENVAKLLPGSKKRQCPWRVLDRNSKVFCCIVCIFKRGRGSRGGAEWVVSFPWPTFDGGN